LAAAELEFVKSGSLGVGVYVVVGHAVVRPEVVEVGHTLKVWELDQPTGRQERPRPPVLLPVVSAIAGEEAFGLLAHFVHLVFAEGFVPVSVRSSVGTLRRL
jgi:hypothetical protein